LHKCTHQGPHENEPYQATHQQNIERTNLVPVALKHPIASSVNKRFRHHGTYLGCSTWAKKIGKIIKDANWSGEGTQYRK
jgi:hypothetical protein